MLTRTWGWASSEHIQCQPKVCETAVWTYDCHENSVALHSPPQPCQCMCVSHWQVGKVSELYCLAPHFRRGLICPEYRCEAWRELWFRTPIEIAYELSNLCLLLATASMEHYLPRNFEFQNVFTAGKIFHGTIPTLPTTEFLIRNVSTIGNVFQGTLPAMDL